MAPRSTLSTLAVTAVLLATALGSGLPAGVLVNGLYHSADGEYLFDTFVLDGTDLTFNGVATPGVGGMAMARAPDGTIYSASYTRPWNLYKFVGGNLVSTTPIPDYFEGAEHAVLTGIAVHPSEGRLHFDFDGVDTPIFTINPDDLSDFEVLSDPKPFENFARIATIPNGNLDDVYLVGFPPSIYHYHTVTDQITVIDADLPAAYSIPALRDGVLYIVLQFNGTAALFRYPNAPASNERELVAVLEDPLITVAPNDQLVVWKLKFTANNKYAYVSYGTWMAAYDADTGEKVASFFMQSVMGRIPMQFSLFGDLPDPDVPEEEHEAVEEEHETVEEEHEAVEEEHEAVEEEHEAVEEEHEAPIEPPTECLNQLLLVGTSPCPYRAPCSYCFFDWQCITRSCDENNRCAPVEGDEPCSPCAGAFGHGPLGQCREDCVFSRHCSPGHFCSKGQCSAQREACSACARDVECLSGVCLDGVCTDSSDPLAVPTCVV